MKLSFGPRCPKSVSFTMHVSIPWLRSAMRVPSGCVDHGVRLALPAIASIVLATLRYSDGKDLPNHLACD